MEGGCYSSSQFKPLGDETGVSKRLKRLERATAPDRKHEVSTSPPRRRVALGVLTSSDDGVVLDCDRPFPVAVGAMEVERTVRTPLTNRSELDETLIDGISRLMMSPGPRG